MKRNMIERNTKTLRRDRLSRRAADELARISKRRKKRTPIKSRR